jgi:hypothetical protein
MPLNGNDRTMILNIIERRRPINSALCLSRVKHPASKLDVEKLADAHGITNGATGKRWPRYKLSKVRTADDDDTSSS